MGNREGMIQVEILSADTAAVSKQILDRGIDLYEIRCPDELRLQCRVRRQDYIALESICRSRGERLTILRRTGLIWSLRSLISRPVLMLGLTGILLLSLWISTRVLFIQVEGNITVPDRKILEAAEKAGVSFGAGRRELRSEKLKNALLEEIGELKWACVNTYGCVAVITVRERSGSGQIDGSRFPGSIVAQRDGIVTSCTATKGTLLCSPGQAVTKGQVLISGYTDCGIYIQAGQAEGEVYAQTLRELDAVLPENYILQSGMTAEEKKISLLIGKKRINLWQSSGIRDTLCDRMYEEYYVTLPGGFELPLALAVETIVYRHTASATVDQASAETLLADYSEDYLSSQMVAGRIVSSGTEIQCCDSRFQLTGSYVCLEMIGRQQREQIGEYNGESD